MDEEQILEAISKSGYLFESEIAKFLSSSGYFVESNVIFKDILTNKDREIDLIAEKYDNYSYGANTKVKYFFELKNNSFPIVLMTQFYSNPYQAEQTIKEILTTDETSRNYISNLESSYENLLNDNKPIFTQYCSFAKKGNKNEIMAFHPDELYSSLNKLVWYCESEFTNSIEITEKLNITGFRHWLYLPILLVNDDLYELKIENSKPTLNKVSYSKLLVNFHFNEYLCGTRVYVVTKNHLKNFLEKLTFIENEIAKNMSNYIK